MSRMASKRGRLSAKKTLDGITEELEQLDMAWRHGIGRMPGQKWDYGYLLEALLKKRFYRRERAAIRKAVTATRAPSGGNAPSESHAELTLLIIATIDARKGHNRRS